jgi:ubiquinone/menaquinone biosynthesis C-methylase UbiE
MDDDAEAELQALVTLHRGLDRQGPGDETLARDILAQLPRLPRPPRIADLGCGSGAASVLLARWFETKVTAVDLFPQFLDDLRVRAKHAGCSHLVEAVQADMGSLDWPVGCIDLLWSEGAAYILTFRGALEAWRPLLSAQGVAVISEITWRTDDPPEEVANYWGNAYPAMATEEQNRRHAREAGFTVIATRPLPSNAWWTSYYNPLLERIEVVRDGASAPLASVIEETLKEIDLFRRFSDDYGYTFYILSGSPG